MRDNYLVGKLNDRYPGVGQLYGDGCGYVHFSAAHFFHVHSVTDEGKFRLQIGGELGVEEANRQDAVCVMDQVTRLLLVFVELYLQERDPSILLLPPDWPRTYSPT